ncbi:MAG: hypothetical protein E4H01_14100, partial [Lysobacterales bacterium]
MHTRAAPRTRERTVIRSSTTHSTAPRPEPQETVTMSKTGRAVVYDKPNAPFQVREYPVRDVRAGEVLVRITMSTICRSDIHSYEGHRPNPCPCILGHEII